MYLIGHSDDKYEVSQVEPVEGEEVTYQISMTIFDVKDQDHDDSYEVQVSNGLGILEKKIILWFYMFDQFLMQSLKIGEQSYFFNVDV